ncbi:putative DNA replication licensing factor [Neospora caninum Liverpool]|uniref:DNA helicase n=1 Tax=Neospora caninum (strain Liverpool) TaxID=572307 RepID=F0VPM0_NEOCL|nr:putative DNA replication licensing factor [Neospora caninum Liverpool]CBZ55667.1 putative DNA replication licensing factor [Neospora caninum Liverpool]CEL70409.1 TPA: DNA replication licensing factor, putative [Neospora caninum Liverpool]|eukprot:XP_003885693.1 putative DNA replication licensing factor [Neospora caninum Liverpool]
MSSPLRSRVAGAPESRDLDAEEMEEMQDEVTPLRGYAAQTEGGDERRGNRGHFPGMESQGGRENMETDQLGTQNPDEDAFQRSPLSRRRRPASQREAFSQGFSQNLSEQGPQLSGATHRGLESSASEYGGTPLAIRRVRFARADLGDMGREFLLQDSDMQRLPELPKEVVDSNMEKKFNEFFETFRIEDTEGILDLSEEEKAISALANDQVYVDSGCQSFYAVKLLQYMERRGAAIMAGHSSHAGLSFDVSLQHLFLFDRQLYDAAVNAPQDAIAAFDAILRRKFADLRELHGCFNDDGAMGHLGAEELLLQQAPRLRLFSKPPALMDSARSLDPSIDLDRLVCLKGIVVRTSEVMPEMTMAAFRCQGQKRVDVNEYTACLQEVYECVVNGEALEPKKCQSCGGTNTFELWIEQCAFASKQLIKLVELPEKLQPGETPQSISVFAYDDLVDSCHPGDRVELTGVFKAAPLRVNPRLRLQHAVFRTFVSLIHARKESREATRGSALFLPSLGGEKEKETEEDRDAAERARLAGNADAASATAAALSAGAGAPVPLDGEDFHFSPEVEEKIKEISQRPDVYDLLVRSFAPSLFGREDVKKGILCQLVGGTHLLPCAEEEGETRGQEKGKSKSRHEIHILLCGDPATAKSQLLQYVHKISPRCMYTSGRGSSAVGLTVCVSKDPETREFVLESGAVVLADGGVCCIDEFDKMEEAGRSILHEVMEQQTVTVAKAGIVASLNARTAILASANPVSSRYDRRRAVIENINLPPSLFSRFDLIYLLLDTADPRTDRLLAHRLCRSFGSRKTAETDDGSAAQADTKPPLPAGFLGLYIAYCRYRCAPRLTLEARDHLRDEYLRMRHRDVTSKHPTATIRQLESLIRISEALAKMRLSQEVTRADAIEAVRLMNLATYQSLVDPYTGRIDFDQIHFGQTRQQRMIAQRATEAIKEVLSAAASAPGQAAMTREDIFVKVKELMRETGGRHEIVEPNLLFEALANLEKDQIVTKKPGGLYHMSASPATA